MCARRDSDRGWGVKEDILVLKLGGSVLTGPRAIGTAVKEVMSWVCRGYRVVAVVSAFEGETDRLLGVAAGLGGAGEDPWGTAALLATGEMTSAAVLTLALGGQGVRALMLDAAGIGLKTTEVALDAHPLGVNVDRIDAVLREGEVLVTPGFTGRDGRSRVTLLGRGGSDLTALFLAAELRARCRLVKDVAGLFERDPAIDPSARLFERASWDDALGLDGGIVQHKGVRLAKSRTLEFEIAAAGEGFATRVGNFNAAFAARAAVPQGAA